MANPSTLIVYIFSQFSTFPGVFIGWTVGLMSTLLPIFSKEKYTYNNKFSVCDVDLSKGSVSVSSVFAM